MSSQAPGFCNFDFQILHFNNSAEVIFLSVFKPQPFCDDYLDYLHDESRTSGYAESISFPRSEDEAAGLMHMLYNAGTPVTIQGARTGLAAAAVPFGGHIMNLSRMDRVLSPEKAPDGAFLVTVEPGLTLLKLRKFLEEKHFETGAFSPASEAALREFEKAPQQFFPPDPTEATASLGGMAACNASGARSFLYGAMRAHVERARVVLPDGDRLTLVRGACAAAGRTLTLTTDSAREYTLTLPGYRMPDTKNASGYYIAPGMDALDLFLGSDGTLGAITSLTLRLRPLPPVIWGVNCFFAREEDALSFVARVREDRSGLAAIEFFDADAMAILRRQKAEHPAFSSLQPTDPEMRAVVSIELHAQTEEGAFSLLERIGALMNACGGDERASWVARTAADLAQLSFFRHAIPESVNMLIDERRRKNSVITKLGTDLSVPDAHLEDMMRAYRDGLREEELESAIWGHIGANHLHVNILPRSEAEYHKGKALHARWAQLAAAYGGAVSAEHGVGKIKAPFLRLMYGDAHVAEMAALKAQLDPKGLLGRGNLFAGKGDVI